MRENCEDIRDKIAAAMAGGADEGCSDEIAEHLRTCPECRAYREALAEDDRLLDAFARAADDTLSRLETRVMETLHDEGRARVAREAVRIRWRTRSLIGLAAAAALVIVALALTILLDTSGGGGVVWADVIAKVEDAQEYICRRIEKRSGEAPIDMVEYRSAEHGLRQDIYENGKLQAVQYIVPQEKKMYALIHRDRAYMQMELSEEQVAEYQRQSNAKEIVRSFRDHPYRELGRRRIDGSVAEGIEITDVGEWQEVFEEGEWRLWVDVQTQWPVLIELEGIAAGGSVRKTYTLKDFQWNPGLTADDFAFEIPDDYRLIADLDPVVADEEHAISGLRSYAELMHGRYPSSLSLATAIAEAEDFLEKHARYDERAGRDLESLFDIRSACKFYAELVEGGKNPAYHGDSVRSTDFDRVLMRWRLDDGTYRVIYGDLRAQTVDSLRAAELEQR